MTDTNKSAAAGATDGEVDNAFGGAVDGNDEMLKKAEEAKSGNSEQASDESAEAGPAEAASQDATNLETQADEAEAVSDAAGEGDSAQSEAEQEHPDTKLAAERLADLQRIQAEYVNYRNRVERDREKEKAATIGSVVESLIPVLDDIELARQHGDLADGPMAKIAEKIETTLGRFGVARFGEAGEHFDPNIHEALMHVEAEAPEGVEGTFVVQVLQPGYKVGERIVRAARVSVAG